MEDPSLSLPPSSLSFFLYASFSIYDGLQEMNKFFLQRKKLNLKNLEKAENKTMSFCNTVTYVIRFSRSHLNRSERHMMRWQRNFLILHSQTTEVRVSWNPQWLNRLAEVQLETADTRFRLEARHRAASSFLPGAPLGALPVAFPGLTGIPGLTSHSLQFPWSILRITNITSWAGKTVTTKKQQQNTGLQCKRKSEGAFPNSSDTPEIVLGGSEVIPVTTQCTFQVGKWLAWAARYTGTIPRTPFLHTDVLAVQCANKLPRSKKLSFLPQVQAQTWNPPLQFHSCL